MKKTLLLALFILLVSTDASAYQFYYFDKSKIKTSERLFRRYVRPQAREIINDFFHTIRKVKSSATELVRIRKKILSIRAEWKEWTESCIKTSAECDKQLRDIYHHTRNLDKKILVSQKNENTKFSSTITSNNDSQMFLLGTLDDLSNLNYKLMHYIETLLISSVSHYNINFKKEPDLTQLLYHMQTLADSIISSSLDKKLQPPFESVWLHYIKPLEKIAMIDRDQDMLLTRLEAFNTSWNSFHMAMVKGNIKVSKDIIKTIKIMHNRWNSILKFYLKHTKFVEES